MPPAAKDYRNHQNCMLSGWGLRSVSRSSLNLADRLQKVRKSTRKMFCNYYCLTDLDFLDEFDRGRLRRMRSEQFNISMRFGLFSSHF